MTSGYVRYDYAWNTPAWTSQNPTFDGQTDGFIDPGMPDDVSLVHVYGSFMEFGTGRPLEGVLRLRVDETLTYEPMNQPVMQGAMRPIRITQYRPLDLHLPATNDPQLSPEFKYEATLTVRGVKEKFTFSLPAEVPEVNINTLIQQYKESLNLPPKPDPEVNYYFDGGTP